MSAADNYDDVVAQLRAAGLLFDGLEIGRLTRCRVEGDREKRGWYALHEFRLANGRTVLVGTFGVWHGAERNAQKIELRKTDLTSEQRSAIRARIAEDRRIAEVRRKREGERAAQRAQAAWVRCGATWTPPNGAPCVANDYTMRKGVGAHGVRFSARGNLVVPATDVHGNIKALQIIYHDKKAIQRKGRDKDYWPSGVMTRGHFHLIGRPSPVILVAEGYATAATLHEATGLPVVVAFSAGNLLPVAQTLRAHYRSSRLLFCADDDALGRCRACSKRTPQPAPTCTHCGADTSTLNNVGVSAASTAALAVAGAWIAPVFADRGLRKLTDFNDLARESTALAVRTQIMAKIQDLGWPTRIDDSEANGDAADFRFSTDVLLKEYVLIYPSELAFDCRRKLLVTHSALRAVAGKAVFRSWQEHPARRVVAASAVVFDPTGEADPATTCNLWGGFPTMPRAGSCDLMLELLEFLFGEVYPWVIRWFAYPLQNHGAKLQSALLIQGPQGSGKSMVVGWFLRIYAQYATTIGQFELESQFNSWQSRKLFVVCDEVISKREKHHVADRMKSMITDDRILINEKGLPLREERNCANFVFLSNRADIAALDTDDRRFLVRWTPPPLSADFYAAVAVEAESGGIEALHDYLLRLDLGDFSPTTKPPVNGDKRELIEITRDNTEAFIHEWTKGELRVPFAPARSEQVYSAYRAWCARVGVARPAPLPIVLGNVTKRAQVVRRRAWYLPEGSTQRAKSWFVVPVGDEAPAGQTDLIWLGECVAAFDSALQEMKP